MNANFLDGPTDPDAWIGVHLRCNITGEAVFPRSCVDVPISFGEPTSEERARGYALRSVKLSPRETWEFSTCLDCGLELGAHPEARRKRSRPRYCREARLTAEMEANAETAAQ